MIPHGKKGSGQQVRGGLMLARLCLACAALVIASPSFGIEPLTLMMLRIIRDQAISAGIEAGARSLAEQPEAPRMTTWHALPALPSGSEEEHLKALIDESFAYLDPGQRAAVHHSLMRVVTDPQHAAIKPQIIAEFRIKASTVRETYRMLDRLSWNEKKALAAQARDHYRKLDEAQQSELLAAVRSGMLPIPRDLHEIIVTEFSSVQSPVNVRHP
jgi:hypothetical protein